MGKLVNTNISMLNLLKDVGAVLEYHPDVKKIMGSYLLSRNVKESPSKLLNIIGKVESVSLLDTLDSMSMRVLLRRESGDSYVKVSFSLTYLNKYKNPDYIIKEILDSIRLHFSILPKNEATSLLYSPK